MRKSSFYYLNQVKSVSLLFLLIFFYSIGVKGQLSNSFLTQTQLDPKTHYPLIFLNPQAVNQPAASPVWENIQSVSIPQQISPGIFARPVTINLDQVRNGSADSRLEPPGWVNGNAGASNAHYVEGYSIPYRLVIENLVGTGLRSVDIEWDTRHSGANALDFITNFDLIDYPAGSHVFNFGHLQESINPLYPEGFIVTEGTSPNILQPANLVANALTTFNAIQTAGRGKFGIWNASITPVTGYPTGLRYITQNPLTGAQSSTRLRIYFTNTAPTVIISWGGHIARGADWGPGNSASAVSGSPYHTRTIEWDPQGDDVNPESLGNQDRSLSAAAVLDPPKCTLTGPTSLECNATTTFYSGVNTSDIAPASPGVTYKWELVDNNTGATACTTTPPVEYFCVNAGKGCNTFTVKFTLSKTTGTGGSQTTNEISRCIQIVTVTDVVPPVISGVGGPSTIDCPATPTFSSPTASDACSNSTVAIASSDQTTNSCGNARTVTRKWTATDGCGNTATASQTITVRDITPPVISGVGGPSTIDCPATPTFSSPTASDACSGSTLALVPSDQETTSCGNARTVTRKWTATDACGNTATASQTITVRDITPPVISGVGGPSTIDCPATPTFSSPTASDACSGSTLALVPSDETTNSCGNARTVTRKWTATDACGNTATASQTITVRDITPPVISGVGGPSTIDCPATPTFSTPTASDACANSTVTITSSDNTVTSCGNARAVTRKWTATDECGNTTTASQTITVRDITPPVISGVGGPSTIDCPASPTFSTPTASDACANSTVTITSSDNTVTSCGNARTVTRKWTATDACGNTATASQAITVTDNTPPVISGVGGPSTIDCPATPTFSTPTASDACTNSTATLAFTDNTVTSCGNARAVTRKWTATDACGNTATASQTITVRDITPPVITCPPNIVVECDVNIETASLGSATASDACSTPSVSSSDGPPVVKACVTVVTRTWVARDACGNTSSCTQIITKRDNTGPVINCTLGTATDNCSPQGDITIYLNNGIWTAIDGSGNVTTATANCSVQGAGRLSTSQVTVEQKEQPITIVEEKTISPGAVKQLPSGLNVQAIPNPFNDRVKFMVTTPEAGMATLDVMNMLGQKVKTVFQGQMNAGSQSFEMVLPQARYSALFYILRINGKQVTGKLVQRN